MSVAEIHENDVGTVFEVTLKDDDVIVDISGATTTLQIKFESPLGDVTAQTAAFVTDGTDGKLKYVTVAGDLTPAGMWKLQALVVWPSGDQWHSAQHEFRVYENL